MGKSNSKKLGKHLKCLQKNGVINYGISTIKYYMFIKHLLIGFLIA